MQKFWHFWRKKKIHPKKSLRSVLQQAIQFFLSPWSNLSHYGWIVSTTAQFTRNIKGPSNTLSCNRCYRLWPLLTAMVLQYFKVESSDKTFHMKMNLICMKIKTLQVEHILDPHSWIVSVHTKTPFDTGKRQLGSEKFYENHMYDSQWNKTAEMGNKLK